MRITTKTIIKLENNWTLKGKLKQLKNIYKLNDTALLNAVYVAEKNETTIIITERCYI